MLNIFKKKNIINNFKNIFIDEADYTVIDTELTGLKENKDTIIAIGSIKMKGKTIKIGEIFYRTINTNTPLNNEIVKIHGITPSELNKCPDIKPILKEFLSFCKNSILIGHYVMIDLCFLKKEINSHLDKTFDPPAIDTFLIYRWLVNKGILIDKENYKSSLHDIAQSLGIQIKNLHHALSDAFITAQIFQRFLTYLGDIKIYTVEELEKIGKPDLSKYMGIIKNEAYQL